MKKKRQYYSKEEALAKLQRYCAYQDRCHQEVRTKLLDHGIYGDELEEVISELILDNFLNEERFARSYARGKFRIKKWGKIKIRIELKKRKISDYCLRKAMEEIEDEEYEKTIDELIERKWNEIRETNDFKKKGKVAKYLEGKGYERAFIWYSIKKRD